MGVMSLRPYQNEAVEAIENEWKSGHKRTLLVLPTGCHEPDQGILMFDGSIKKAKDIAVGDILMGDNGMPRTVLKLHHGTDMMYKVVPIKGSPFIVNGEHVLPLVRTSECRNDKNSGRVDCIKVKDYLNETQNYKHLHKLYRSDALMAFGGDDTQLPMLPIDPYFLGVLLGDGGLTQSITITTPEPEIAAEIFKQAQKYGMTIRTEPAGAAQTFHMRSFTLGCKGSALRQRLKALNIMGHDAHTKRIPQMYKTAPYAERLQVLAGLIDTDGHLTFNGYDYISASETLAYDVAFISRSVGLAAYITPCEKGYGDSFKGKYWRVSISGCCDRIPLRVERKRSKERLQKKNVLRTGIREISLVGEGEYFGFTVDGNNLYLMEDFTVTHNCGKTIVFSKVVADTVKDGGRALILAHRGELLQQAADKLKNTTGIDSALDKAASHGAESFLPVTVGSIQTLMRDNRLQEYDPDHFDTIVVDEAHHALSESYKKVLDYFTGNVLGVTATPDRGDMKSLGEFFESLAYEYTLPQAIREGYLCPIKAQTIPLNIDLTKVRTQQGDYATGDLGNALEPYLDQIADTIAEKYADRKMVVFLPLIATSQHFCQLLIDRGLNALEVNGNSKDRDEVIKTFDSMDRGILCNSMLLTEGWDCPSVDCIVVLRPTKIRSLYCLDESTEVLTHNGWKKDVDFNEEVAAFDLETESIVFTPVTAKVRRPLYDDEYFCSIKGQSSDIRVTNRHRIVYDNKRRKGWKIKAAEEIADMKDGCYIPVSGHGLFSGVPLSDDELRFIGWVMTDGTINKINNAITITQEKHQPWLEEIQKCIDGCGFKYNRFERFIDTGYNRTSPAVCWTISKGQPRGRDKHLRGWEALEPYLSKDMSPLLHQMTEEQFDIMLEAINLGDGSKQHSKTWTQQSYHIRKGNKTFIENLQIMALRRGYRANITESLNNNGNPIYGIHLKKQSFIKIGSRYDRHATWVKEEHHDSEKCWCVQNAKGTLVTRRNGKVAIIGNCQMVGRGTRLCDGKDHLLILDFLWMTTKHELCRPTCLICKKEEIAKAIENKMDTSGEVIDINDDTIKDVEEDVRKQREDALAKELAEQRKKKAKLVDPLQFEMSILDEDLQGYEPTFGWEMEQPTQRQLETIEKMGLNPDGITTKGYATMLLDRLMKRIQLHMSTPKQIRLLERYGFKNVGAWAFDEASKMISRVHMSGWSVPRGVVASEYIPESLKKAPMDTSIFAWD